MPKKLPIISLMISLSLLLILSLMSSVPTYAATTVQVRSGDARTFSDGPQYYCFANTDYYIANPPMPSQFDITYDPPLADIETYAQGVYIRLPGQWVQMSTTLPTTVVGVEFWGYYGVAIVKVDGTTVWSGDPGPSQIYVEVSGLVNTNHTITVTPQGTVLGTFDLSIYYFGIGKQGVTPPPPPPPNPPVITSIDGTSNPITLGKAMSYTINGQNFGSGCSVAISGPGATVKSTRYGSSTQIKTDIIFTTAALGTTQTFTVTNPDGLSASSSFNVPSLNTGPVISSIVVTGAPTTDASGVLIMYDIYGKNFMPETLCSVTGPGATLMELTYVAQDYIHIQIHYTAASSKTRVTITVTNPGGFSDSTTVTPNLSGTGPVISSIVVTGAPTTDASGVLIMYDIYGKNFMPETLCSVTGPGAILIELTYVAQDYIHIQIHYTAASSKTRVTITVTNPGGFSDSTTISAPIIKY
jgi:hypothetical protein